MTSWFLKKSFELRNATEPRRAIVVLVVTDVRNPIFSST